MKAVSRVPRLLKRSPTAVTGALNLLEAHDGAELLHRTTRRLKLSEAGEGVDLALRIGNLVGSRWWPPGSAAM
jgi:DNA-binding transcriptional LysR family regulator